MVFVAGARTDTNVGIRSTHGDLLDAYGLRLIPDPNREPGYGYLIIDRSGRRRQRAIAFGFDTLKQRVQWVAYGTRRTVGEYRRTLTVDC